MSKLILLRHGQSMWNLANLFTGWIDIPLSQKGIDESLEAGKQIKDTPIDVIYVSSLIRSQMTAMLAMTHHSSKKAPVIQHAHEGKLEEWGRNFGDPTLTIPVFRAWELNERMYGDLQGLNKQETIDKFGPEQVQLWRRSYDIAPPNGESLAMTAERSIPYFEKEIEPHLKAGRNVLIAAHGNSLRSIAMRLENLSKEEVLHLELATGMPIIYNYTQGRYEKCLPRQ